MKKRNILIIFLIFFFGSCDDQLLSSDYQGGDWFYLENAGAKMPVWVTGNKASNVFIVFLHGGPGSSAIGQKTMTGLQKMEQEYAIVYWDQRGSGISQGNAKPESFTVEQCVEDLQKLIHLIRYKYNNPKLFLMGNSWGGTLGTVYLLDSENQKYFSGWIDIDGDTDWGISEILSVEWAKNKAREKIAAGEDVDYWEKELEWYDNVPPSYDFGLSDRHYENLDKLNGISYSGSFTINYLDYLTTPMTFSYPMNQSNILDNFTWPTFNLHPEMYKITVPAMILWGRHDGIIPVEMAQTAFDSLGTNANDKYLYIFENSAHTPHIEEQDLFVRRVREFIEKYK